MTATNDAAPELTAPPGIPMLLRDLLHERTGLFFETDRVPLLLEKLTDRVRARGYSSYLDYYYLLKYDHDAEPEWRRVMDALSVPETYFWREPSQIRALVDRIVPTWFATRDDPLQIWSAACATGEEPYSLAIALREAGHAGLPITIVASDASEAALEKARVGVYRERSFRAIAPDLRARYFDAPTPSGSRLRTELLPTVQFARANLLVPADIGRLAASPVVFCRNVFIYFSPEAIRRTVASFARLMPGDGKLFVGASESLLRVAPDFDLREIDDAFVYVRHPRAA